MSNRYISPVSWSTTSDLPTIRRLLLPIFADIIHRRCSSASAGNPASLLRRLPPGRYPEIGEPQVGENGRARSVKCLRGRQTVLRRPSLADGRRDEAAPRQGTGIIAANSHAYLKAALRLNPQCVRIVRQLLCRGRQHATQGRLTFPALGEIAPPTSASSSSFVGRRSR